MSRRRLVPLLAALLLLLGSVAPVEAGGRIRLIVPEIGISALIRPLACGTPRLPDGRVYAWGCVERPNRYLLSHAYATFRPLRLAAESGRLHRGMRLILRYPDGHREVYRLVSWAIFRTARPLPSRVIDWMTSRERGVSLQTCLYRNSSGRVVARFLPLR